MEEKHKDLLEELVLVCINKGFKPKTVEKYFFYVKDFLIFIERFGLIISPTSVKTYLLATEFTIKSTRIVFNALKFFFEHILKESLKSKG